MLKARPLSLSESSNSLFTKAEFHRHADPHKSVGVHPLETSQSGKGCVIPELLSVHARCRFAGGVKRSEKRVVRNIMNSS